MAHPIDFGLFLSPEGLTYKPILKDARHAEDLGFHSIWTSDHLIGVDTDPREPRLEAWTMLSALAGSTHRIRLGSFVLCNPLRHPPLLAKMATTLDIISEGRLDLGIGTGWYEPEFIAYGYPIESPAVRVGRLREAVEIIKLLWMEERASYQGRYYRIEDAACSPKPIQAPYPPILIGGSGEQLMLRLAAEHANICNFAAWKGTPTFYDNKRKVLEQRCREVGRDLEEIRISWATNAVVGESKRETELKALEFSKMMVATYGSSTMAFTPQILGTPEMVAEQLRSYIEAGVSLFILGFVGDDQWSQRELFARDVAPIFT